MLLFFISVLLVCATSFFLTSLLENKRVITALIYFLVFSFANVVVIFEILSLFTAISELGVLLLNFLFTVITFGIWFKKGCPLFEFKADSFYKRFYSALKSDKYLMVLAFALLFTILVSLWLMSFMPIVNPDATAYHVLRSLLWIMDGKISHPAISDIRNLVMPINSELLYAWILLFVKKQIWFGLFSFFGYVLSVTSLWGLLSEIGIGFKRRLWTIFILSSFASVIIQISSTETDIIIAGLILVSMYLYLRAVKTSKTIPIIVAALAYALAVGTKTPAIMMIPGVGLWMLWVSVANLGKKFYRPILLFCGCFIISFVIFSAYNYVLNYLDFGNIAGSKYFLSVHQNHGGIKSVLANFIKYMFMFFDFTGFALNSTLGVAVMNLRDSILINLGLERIADGFYTSATSTTNQTLLEPLMGLGLLGFLVYLPSLVVALVRPLFTRKRTDIAIFWFAVIFLLAILAMSASISFMTYSIRFFTSFCVISSPVLVYSYFKKNNIFKFLIVFFALFYLIFLSTHLWARPALLISRYFINGSTISDVREISVCSKFNNAISKKPNAIKNQPLVNEMCIIRNEIRKFDKRNRVLFFSNTADELLVLKLMNFQGYNVDFNIIENMDNIDLSKYNLILVANDEQFSTNVQHFDKMKSGSKYYGDGFVCRYQDSKNRDIVKISKKIPYLSTCSLESYFFNSNKFEFLKVFTVKKLLERSEFTMNYKFYENKNNPIIR